MRVDGRDITVAGSLLQPLTRRTNDIVRLALATVFLAIVVTSSLITRNDWVGLEKSVSRIVGRAHPDPVESGVPGIRHRDFGAAVHDPGRPDCRPAVEAARAHMRPPGSSRCSPCRSPETGSPPRAGISTSPSGCRPPCHSSLTPPVDRDAGRRPDGVRAHGCRPAGAGGGGRCCWRSCRSTSSSARSSRPARYSAWQWARSSARSSCWLSAPRPSRSPSTTRCGRWRDAASVVNALTVVRPAGQGPLELSATNDAGAQVVLGRTAPTSAAPGLCGSSGGG